ncbi:MAG: type II toxin-antitoxin system VapC family toxin [Burkholderiaceae bacterium]|jgi:tRNA(fMet)-specific endonuclease VapC|nr:type II toxin-antitoxin system VapC family toxin [Burkholderiaceae bacterium]
MKRYLLDTNTISHLVKNHPAVTRRVTQVPMTALCMSAITGAELMFGLAKIPAATRLQHAVTELLRRVDVLPWDATVMACYGKLRADLERQGKTLGPLDMLIAAHAVQANAILVSNDAAFKRVAGLNVEDWTRAE